VIRLFRQYISLRRMIFILGEGVLIYCAVALASMFLLESDLGANELFHSIWSRVFLVAVVTQLSLYFNDLYDLKYGKTLTDLAMRIIQSVGFTSLVLGCIYFLWPDAIIGRWIFFSSLILLLLFLVSWRFLYALVVRKKLLTERAIVLGSGGLARDVMKEIKNKRDLTYDIRSLILYEKEKDHAIDLNGIPIVYGFDGICALAEEERASSIIVALDQKRGVMPYRELLNCKTRGISVIDG
jgi:FlaA1/EpsC-like NDP-sugar epimerase